MACVKIKTSIVLTKEESNTLQKAEKILSELYDTMYNTRVEYLRDEHIFISANDIDELITTLSVLRTLSKNVED